ncbi:MAG: hypothetical protein WCP16_22430 [Pseudanabaena sp. ELA645]
MSKNYIIRPSRGGDDDLYSFLSPFCFFCLIILAFHYERNVGFMIPKKVSDLTAYAYSLTDSKGSTTA